MVKTLPAMHSKTQVRSLGQEDSLEKGMAAHSSIPAWRIPWTEEPGRPHSIGLQRTGHNWATEHAHTGRLNNKHRDAQLIRGCFKSPRTSIAHSILTSDLWPVTVCMTRPISLVPLTLLASFPVLKLDTPGPLHLLFLPLNALLTHLIWLVFRYHNS